MKVFVSHSMKDQTFLEGIQKNLNKHGLQLLLAEHEIDMRNSISEKIKAMIDNCHVGLVLFTKNGMESGFVREEIGYLEGKNKPTLIVLEKGLKPELGGFKYGCDYIDLDPEQPELTIEKIKHTLLNYWKNAIDHRNKAIAREEERRKKEEKNALIALGVLASVLILGSRG